MKEEFKWDDELVKEFIRWNFNRNEENSSYLPFAIEDFKKSKQPKKEWEILESWDGGLKHTIHPYKGDNSSVSCEHAGCKIYSVKRLLDGEVFTVGDNVYYKIQEKKSTFKITSIDVEHDDILIRANKIPMCYLKELYKRQRILTTIDGIDIYEGDEYWVVSPINFLLAKQKGDSTWYPYNGDIKFSTKEAAEEFILLNKSALSVNAVMNIFREHFEKYNEMNPSHGRIRNYLIELAKQKIQQP